MSYIDINFDDAVEPSIAPAGRYNLQVTEAQIVKTGEQSKNPGRDQFKISVGFVDHPEYLTARVFLSLPHPDDEAKTNNFKVLQLKRFLVAFNVPFSPSGIDLEQTAMEMVGATANNVEVGLTEPNANGTIYNNVIFPRLPTEYSR